MSYNNKDFNTSNILDLEEGEISNELINPEKNIIGEGTEIAMTKTQDNNGGEGNKDEEEHQNFFHKMMEIPNNEKDSTKSNPKFLGNKRDKSPSPKRDVLSNRRQGANALFYQKKPCQYYLSGFCTKGKYCKFSHDFNLNTNANTNTIISNRNNDGGYNKKTIPNSASYSQLKNMKRDLCKYFVNGKCLKGDNCTFSHTLKDFPCKIYQLTGYCEEEDDCKFAHKKLNQEEMMKFIKDNEVAILEHKNEFKSTKIDNELKVYIENKANMQSSINQSAMWKPKTGFPINALPLNIPLISGQQQQKNILTQYPLYPNAPFTMPYMPFFHMITNSMMIPNQLNLQSNSINANTAMFSQNSQLTSENGTMLLKEIPSNNEVKNDKEKPNDNRSQSDNSSFEDREFKPIQNNKPEQNDNSDNNANSNDNEKKSQKEEQIKNESNEDLIQKIVEALKQKAPQDPRIRNKN